MNKQNTDAVEWLRAWRHRCCPPDYILHEKKSPQLDRHLEHCPWCRNDLKRGPAGFHIPDDLISDDSGPQAVPGQLWSVSDSLSGWGPKNRYYNPPLVLIIDQPDPHAVNIVQVCDDMTFFGPDDVVLDNDRIGFAQPWNRYTLKKTDLGFFFGSVSTGLLQQLTTDSDTHAGELEPGSLLWFFRQMEVETGFFFAEQAMHALMAHYETENVQPDDSGLDNLLKYRNTGELLADILHLPLQYPETQNRDVPLSQALALLKPESRLLPRAAAGPEKSVTGLVLIVQDDRIRGVETTEFKITHQACHGEMLHIIGHAQQDDYGSGSLLFYWQCGSQLSQIIEPVPGESGCREKVFWAVFPVAECENPMQGRLIVRILTRE